MNWKTINKKESQIIMNYWKENPEVNCESEYRELRENLIENFDKTIKSYGYEEDLNYALKIYELLNNKYNMTPRIAADDDIWRYISIRVAPDIVYERWGLDPNRYYKNPRRIWYKTLWWYIHLSWQGNIYKTNEILKDNTTDEIVQLVERTGSSGYRIDSYRMIMKIYGSYKKEKRTRSTGLFRKVMKLNTARAKVIEPTLVEGGEEAYAEELFNYFKESRD